MKYGLRLQKGIVQKILLSMLVSFFLLSGCGQTGDLYLPADEPQADEEQAAEE